MTIDFYYSPGSPPCRTVLLAAEAIGVKLNLKLIDMMKAENLTPEFLKLNPQHTIPTINDNGFVLWESRAIITYLQSQYGKDDSLYPKDPKRRAVVDQRLNFDIGTLFARFGECYGPVIRGISPIDAEKLENVNKALTFLDTFLKDLKYAAGDNLTLADLSLVSTISTIEVFGHDLSPYKNIATWYARVKKTAPGYEEANAKNALVMKKFFENFRKAK